jgi:hypothetical protein
VLAAPLMPRFLLAALLPLAALLSAIACDTGAKGVNECRQMETERCTAARSCDFGIDSDERLADCKRFARDNCLHGLSTGVEPKPAEVENCVRVIRTMGECAAESGDQPIAECTDIELTTEDELTVCNVVENPTLAAQCAWLLQDPPEPVQPPEPDGG